MPHKKTLSEIKKSEKNKMEQRFFTKTEFRVSDDGKKIVGYAAKFNDLSPDYYGFKEFIAPGAFTKTIKEADIRALFNHNPDFVLGRTSSGTLTLKEDKTGLWYEIELPDTQQGRDLYELIKRGDISQSSFGFQIIKQSWEEKDDDIIRGILEVKLFDVSPVTYPWYPSTESSVRTLIIPEGEDEKKVTSALLKLKNNIELKNEDLQLLKQYVTNIKDRITPEPHKQHSDKSEEERAAAWKYCICDCGYWEDKAAGEACKLIECPKCGAELTGSNEKPKGESKSEPGNNHSKKSEEPQKKELDKKEEPAKKEEHSEDLNIMLCEADELLAELK